MDVDLLEKEWGILKLTSRDTKYTRRLKEVQKLIQLLANISYEANFILKLPRTET